MTTTKTARLLAALLATSLLAACSKGFETLNSATGNSAQGGNSGQSADGGTTLPSGPSEFEKLDMSTYVAGGSYDNEQVIALDKANNALLIYLPLPAGAFTAINVEAPQLKGVRIATVLDSQQKARVAVSIPLKLIVKDKVTSLPSASTLPGGRPLPMMPSGEYPSLGLEIKAGSEKIYLYLGVNAVGVFVESSFFPEYIGITAPIKNAARTRTLGYFTIVPKQSVNKGGLFLSFLMPKDLATIIDNHLSGIIN